MVLRIIEFSPEDLLRLSPLEVDPAADPQSAQPNHIDPRGAFRHLQFAGAIHSHCIHGTWLYFGSLHIWVTKQTASVCSCLGNRSVKVLTKLRVLEELTAAAGIYRPLTLLTYCRNRRTVPLRMCPIEGISSRS